MNPDEFIELIELLEIWSRRRDQRLFYRLFPDQDTEQDDGTIFHARDKYKKHTEFFEAGAQYRERALIAANRSGKTICGAYEVSAHLTGLYPTWWRGRRFHYPVQVWAAGKTNETTRDIVQAALCGKVMGEGTQARSVSGTGLIPGDRLDRRPTWKQGVTNLIDTIEVRHVTGEYSTLGLKSGQQGRGAFEGTARNVIWLDEEMDDPGIYDECLTRTAIVPGSTEGGLIFCTFTPLQGRTRTVQRFMPRPAL